MGRIENSTRGTLIADKVEVARSFMARGRGLMGRRSLPEGFALIIYPESSIHMFFMHVPIDALFVDSKHQVIAVSRNLPPWHPFAGVAPWKGRYVIELPAGVVDATGTQPGDVLAIEPALD